MRVFVKRKSDTDILITCTKIKVPRSPADSPALVGLVLPDDQLVLVFMKSSKSGIFVNMNRSSKQYVLVKV